jgi:hypothetical protein
LLDITIRKFFFIPIVTEVGPAYPRDLPARAILAPPAPISTAPSHLASSLALDSSNTGVSDLTLLLCDTNIKIQIIADRLSRDQINSRIEPLSKTEPVLITISMKWPNIEITKEIVKKYLVDIGEYFGLQKAKNKKHLILKCLDESCGFYYHIY